MSLDDSGPTRASRNRWRKPLGLSLLFAAAMALSACGDAGGGFRPLYGAGATGNVSEQLKQVDFSPIPGRVGQRIRNEMIFQTTGGGDQLPPTHRLEVVLAETLTSTLVNVQGEAAGQVYSVQATFRLVDTKDKKVVFQGTSHGRAGFERFESIYSNVRAREDAENRVARIIAEDLKTRLAAYLSRAT
jgi:LPS-assembly lipoprotein